MTKARDLANLISGGFTEADIPNLSASKITSGTFADARLSQSSVQQYASTFDDNKIVNDISTLGLRVHTQENLNASNTNSASFDVFQDSSGITNLTNCQRDSGEFVASVVGALNDNTQAINNSNKATHLPFDSNRFSATKNTSGMATSGTSGFYDPTRANNMTMYSSSGLNGNGTLSSGNETNMWDYMFGTPSSNTAYFVNNMDTSGSGGYRLTFMNYAMPTNYTIKFNGTQSVRWRNGAGSTQNLTLFGVDSNYSPTTLGEYDTSTSGTFVNGDTVSFNVSSSTFYPNFSIRVYHHADNAWMFDSLVLNATVRENTLVANATGSFEGNAITVSSTNKMGAVITYQDNAGTNALNTDIIMKLSADNGSNYSTATLTALPDFATGIKMAKVNDLSVTAGTQLKYKIEFANQAAGSKEARIRGVSLQY